MQGGGWWPRRQSRVRGREAVGGGCVDAHEIKEGLQEGSGSVGDVRADEARGDGRANGGRLEAAPRH